MVKRKKILFFILFCLVNFTFVSNVSAEAEVEYYTGLNNTFIYYNLSDNYYCESAGNGCESVIISGDDSKYDNDFFISSLETPANTRTLSKETFADGYVLSGSEEINNTLLWGSDISPKELPNVEKVIYFIATPEAAVKLIEEAKKFDNIYFKPSYYYNLIDFSYKIPEGVTITTVSFNGKNIELNGKIKTSCFYGTGITGKGTIDLEYSTIPEDGGLDGTPAEYSDRFIASNFSSDIKVNLITDLSLDGLNFGYIGDESDSTEDIEKGFEIYKNALSIEGYELIKNEANIKFVYGEQKTVYYGTLKKIESSNENNNHNSSSTIDSNTVTKNPKTSDNTYITLVLIVIAILSLTMSVINISKKSKL